MKDKHNLRGGCPCGDVKYTINEKPLFTQACHCKDCKILTGSSFVINTSIFDNSLDIKGELSKGELIAGSGKKVTVYFCKKCGVYIYADYETAVRRLTVRTKTLENSDMFPPQVHIFTKDKDPWLNLSGDQNCYEEMYDPNKEWPEESIKRYKEYLNKI